MTLIDVVTYLSMFLVGCAGGVYIAALQYRCRAERLLAAISEVFTDAGPNLK